MAFQLLQRKRSTLGIHFGSECLAGVVLAQGSELIKRCDGVQLANFDAPEAALHELVSLLDARGAAVISHLDPEQVFTRILQMDPDLEDADIHEQMHLVATEALQLDLADIALDYCVQGVSYAGQAMADVLLFACPLALVREREALLVGAGLKVRAIEPLEQSLQRAFCSLVRDMPDAHHRHVTLMLCTSREQFDVWLFEGRTLRETLQIPATSGWQHLWDAADDASAHKSLCASEARMLCKQLHETARQRLGERISRWLLLPSSISRALANAIQEVDSPLAIIEMRPNPDSEAASRIPSDAMIKAFGLALSGAGT